MYLSNIKLWNFRKYGSDAFDLEHPNIDLSFNKNLNVLIGENDSGKTAIIDAIKLVLKTQSYDWIRVDKEDFYQNQDRFRIELRFEDFSTSEAMHFTEWLGMVGDGVSAKPYLKLIYDVKRNNERILPADIKAGADETGYPLTAEAADYLKVTYLKPLRDAENELISKKNSRVAQIFQNHEAFKDKDDHHLLGLFRDFNKSIEKYFEGKTKDDVDLEDRQGKELKDKIDAYIHSFYDETKESNYTTSEANLKSILEKLELSIKGIVNPGLGTLNRLFMAAELLHLQKDNWNGLKLGLIEELEAHLHPQAQMKVIQALQEQQEIQLILSTHSPNLASKVKLENLIFCEGKNTFPMGKEYTELEPDNYSFLERFLDVTKANLFFAKGIILVEGWAEEILIPAIAKKIGFDLTKYEVSIVNIGHTGFRHYAKIFLRQNVPVMNVPVSIITDVDVRIYEKISDDCFNRRDDGLIQSESDTRKTNLADDYNKNNNKVFMTPKWTLEWCLFESRFFSEKFVEVVKSIHTQTDWTNFEEILARKLINRSLNKTEIAYKLAQKIDNETSISIDADDTINYIKEAIRYACRQRTLVRRIPRRS